MVHQQQCEALVHDLKSLQQLILKGPIREQIANLNQREHDRCVDLQKEVVTKPD
jgi:hypothetical protein